MRPVEAHSRAVWRATVADIIPDGGSGCWRRLGRGGWCVLSVLSGEEGGSGHGCTLLTAREEGWAGEEVLRCELGGIDTPVSSTVTASAGAVCELLIGGGRTVGLRFADEPGQREFVRCLDSVQQQGREQTLPSGHRPPPPPLRPYAVTLRQQPPPHGLGLGLGLDGERLVVEQLREGGVACLAGVTVGDELTAVGDAQVAGRGRGGLAQVQSLLRSAAGGEAAGTEAAEFAWHFRRRTPVARWGLGPLRPTPRELAPKQRVRSGQPETPGSAPISPDPRGGSSLLRPTLL
jgi:hypothetical protein